MDGAALLGQFDGFWLAPVSTDPDPDAPVYGSGCAIGSTGNRLVLELFYNPDGVLRFGLETFGAEQFGQYAGTAPTTDRWVDVTTVSYGGQVARGNLRPNINAPADAFTFNMYDPTGDWIDWRPPKSLASPNLNTPCRVGILTRWGVYFQIYQGRIVRMFDIHDTPNRDIEIRTFGNKADLITSLLDPKQPKETATERITDTLTAIGWGNGFDPSWPPTDMADVMLEADQDFRYGENAQAYSIIQQAAVSAGYRVSMNRLGQFRVLPILNPATPTGIIISDCDGPGVDAVATAMEFVSDAAEVLNIVQLVNTAFPQKSAEAIDTTSVAVWGRRADGYGFPVVIANDSSADTQALADQIVAVTANIVNRVERVAFHTLADPRWWTVFGQLEIGQTLTVLRQNPTPITFEAVIIGLDWDLSTDGYISGIINLSTTETTQRIS